MQALGNEIRISAHNPGELAGRMLTNLESGTTYDKIVVDGIRNIGEIQTLREHFGRNFYLIALDCTTSDRFDRLPNVYQGEDAFEKFTADNERDRDQEDPFGQQVEPVC
ncbi:MAG: hypothetical protein M5R38_14450 [Candidatus Methylomirabilis sp.]|nr:hypothetical protein [Candidatus Methylomirabilis sp.]